MRLNPAVAAAPTYPLSRVGEALRAARARGEQPIDLTLGQPCDPIPPFLVDALASGIAATRFEDYPLSAGLPVLREAIAGWVGRRFGATLEPETEVVPTLGSKEPIATLARLFAEPGDTVAVPVPSYPVPERSAIFAGLRVAEVPLSQDGGWLPDPDRVPWEDPRLAIVWIASPHNPTGSIAPLDLLADLAERCRRAGAILAVDEAYSELWFGEGPPASALQLPDRTGVLVLNTLSKRSGVPGLRSGFAAGDPEVVSRLTRLRVDAGTTPQLFVQHASVAAWDDDVHVEEGRARYAERRALLVDAFAEAGLRHAGGDGGMFLWPAAPDGDDVAAYERLATRSVFVVPGSYLGPAGAGHLRVSISRPVAELERVAELLA